MRVGASRPLELDDLWYLTDDMQTKNNADVLEAHFQARLPPNMRFEQYRPKPSALSAASSATVAGRSKLDEKANAPSEATSVTGAQADPKEGRFGLREEEERARREEVEVMVMDTIVAAGLNGTKLEGDAEGTAIDRPIPAMFEDGRPSTPPSSPVRGVTDQRAPGDQSLSNPELVQKYGKKKAAKIALGKLLLDKETGKLYSGSLSGAIYQSMAVRWWKAIILQGMGTALQVTNPLVTKLIIAQMELAYAIHQAEKAGIDTTSYTRPRSVGYGIGLAFAMFVMQMAASVLNYQAQQRGATIGFSTRAALIDLISRKSMRLSGKARVEYPNGRLVTMVSADCSFLDFAAPQTVNLVVQPFEIIVGIALLIYTLGYSALVGLLVLILATPLQGLMFVRMMTYRQAQMKIVDKRVRLLSEIMSNIRAVKLYAYETFFGQKVSGYRQQELAKLRRNGLNRSTMVSTMSFIPILAAVLTYITYGLSGHALNASIIFSGLQYFNILKSPITFLPVAFTLVSDAAVAIGRIGEALRAEELRRDIVIYPKSKYGIEVVGDFAFDSVTPPDAGMVMSNYGPPGSGRGRRGGKDRAGARQAKKQKALARKREKQGMAAPAPIPKKDEGVPFSLRDIDLKVPRGSLVCIVGRVGTGKSALLNGMINEMRQIKGVVVFGGPASYVPQQAWVQSGTIRENITFSVDEAHIDQARVDEVIDACALRPEIELWGDGDRTQIGERGITLSGGQRQRVCLARAAYDTNSEIVLLDDPLSAVDAHVGDHLLRNCILSGPLAHKTRILVTHHLDVLPLADIVLVLDRNDQNEGRIIQQGSYAELREQDGVFRTLMEEFGSSSERVDKKQVVGEKKQVKPKAPGGGTKFLLDEERETGAVSWKVYGQYGKAMGGWIWVAIVAFWLCLTQAATVGNTLFLGFWSGGEINGFRQGDYMGVYAGLGAAIAICTWLASYTMILAAIRASFALFNLAWQHVLRSPTSWHDRTPTGRIISRLSKDIEMLDDRLSMVMNQLLSNALSVVGTFALVVYAYPWLGLVFIPLGVTFYIAASYYRMTSREVKRVDSLARSAIYASFGEQLSGLAVIRAFGQQTAFVRRMQEAVNGENSAYIITITIQRWLGIRLDLISYTLVLLIAIFAAVFRNTVSPSKLGVVLTYTLSAASVFSNLVQVFAQCEQEFNNAERVLHYGALPMEDDPTLPSDPPVNEWPSEGLVEFKDVELRYRPELPLVLRGVSFTLKPGEKVGIIGRTGAGKSSIAQALFRTVELCGGSISIDGRNIRDIGLDTVRSRIAIIPQDAFLFGGTVRDNIDPSGLRANAELERLINLIHENSGNSRSFSDKFKLDATVQNEGQNFSAGERQLLALIRALARGCKVLLLDEATSSVDPETDAVLQRICQTQLSNVTLISIAHRLQTVAYYDRIIVMDNGELVEFDTPLALFDNTDGHFRSLCNTKNLNRGDILKIQKDATTAQRAAGKAVEERY